MESDHSTKRHKLGVASGVYIPVCLNILSILMFLRFGLILGQVGLLGILGLLVVSYCIDLLTTLSLSAVASNGEVKGGGAYYLISRSLGPEFGGSIGILFYLSQVLNTALNVVGLIDCVKLYFGAAAFGGYWKTYLIETATLMGCTAMCLAGSGIFAKASNALLIVLTISTLSIPLSTLFLQPFQDPDLGIEFTGLSLATLRSNLLPPTGQDSHFRGFKTFRDLFGILFPATSGIFAGASMSGDLRNPSKAIPTGTLWAMLTTFCVYLLVIFSLASAITPSSLLRDPNIIQNTSISAPLILAGECATTLFSALMGLVGSAKLLQALARDKLLAGLSVFGLGSKKGDEPVLAIFLTYVLAQFSLFANLNQIATFISMGYQMTFFTMNLACFLLKIGSAPNFRPAFKFFSWHTALGGSVFSAWAMFFIDQTYATSAVCLLVFLFLLIHYLSPPKHWGDVSQNLIYHQVRKYLLRLRPEHIKFWRPQIILLVGDPRRQTRLVQFCNSMKKGSLYILGHVIVTDDFESGVQEAKLQQSAWTTYISEYSRIKAFVQLNMSPTITWGVRNLILSAGLGGMRPNIAVIGFYNMDELRKLQPQVGVPEIPDMPNSLSSSSELAPQAKAPEEQSSSRPKQRHRRDTSARLLESELPTDIIKMEERMSVTDYLTILEDLALRHRLNVAVGKGFSQLETPRGDGKNSKKYIDLWPIQMSARVQADGRSVVTTNFDTYTLILQLGYILYTVPAWKRVYALRVMVFVEYQDEVEEERQRVSALLEKLRIDAEVHVFCLASGELATYEAIVHGEFKDPQIEKFVNETIRGEWWEELKTIRQESFSEDGSESPPNEEAGQSRRRSHISFLSELSKKPTVSLLARLGFNMGIQAQNLPRGAFRLRRSEYSDRDSSDDDEEDIDADFNDVESVASEADLSSFVGSLRQDFFGRRKSLGDASGARKRSTSERDPLVAKSSQGESSYGATNLSRSSTVVGKDGGTAKSTSSSSRSMSRDPSSSGKRPPLSRNQSGLQPGTGTTSQRPGLSRANSSNRFTSSLVPETRIVDAGGTAGPSITFASPERERREFVGARSALTGGDASNDVKIDIPELVASKTKRQNTRFDLGEEEEEDEEDTDTYGRRRSQLSQLSFNDLPSRAQHLIINELMRQHSTDTGVLFTTLPIPEEGTCESEAASVQYLSDVEVLCHKLPPTLLVLSNNMTVTVSL